jgi:predicted phosphoribosyltransferase/dienelactone hydrolase
MTAPSAEPEQSHSRLQVNELTSPEIPPGGNDMMFRDRKDAGQRLALLVKQQHFEKPIVLGIPRGGVPVADEVARALGAPLAVVVARKLGAPENPELAIGATTETGASYVNAAVARAAGASQEYIEAEKARQMAEAHRREELFNSHRRPAVRGRTVVIVDDGIATGATAIAAVRSIKAEGAAKVVLAVPVGPPEMLQLLRSEADDVVFLYEDPGFWAVGFYYDDFSQVTDEEVAEILKRAPAAAHGVRPNADTSPTVLTTAVLIPRQGVLLKGVLSRPPASEPYPLVVFVHGLGSSKESPRNLVIARRLEDAGIATLLFDLSGHGESSPAPADGVDAYISDLEAVYDWAANQPAIDSQRIGVAGSSLGAVVAARALAEGKATPRTMVLRAPPMEPGEFQAVRVPALVLVGSEDSLKHQAAAGAAANPNLRLSVVAGASHLFEEPGTLEEATRQTVDWFRTQLAGVPSPAGASGA